MQTQFPIKRIFYALTAVIVMLVIVTAWLNTEQDFSTSISIFATRFLGIFIEAAPFLLLGTIASGLIEAFVSADDIARFVPKNPILATLLGSVLGFTFPVCECGVVPVVRRLYTKGLPISVGITFLLAAPVINPVVLVATYVAFGFGPVLIGRFVITIVISIIVGLVFAFRGHAREILQPAARMPLVPMMGGSGDSIAMKIDPKEVIPLYQKTPRRSLGSGIKVALCMAGDEFFEMGRYMIFGSMIAAGMQMLISQDVLLALGRGPVVSVLIMQVLAFVLSVCSTVDAFLALAFTNTFTTGSILSFLTFGPMVDIKSMMMFRGVFTTRIVLYLILLPFLLALLIGVWINLNIAFV